jgi:hypothetical protein
MRRKYLDQLIVFPEKTSYHEVIVQKALEFKWETNNTSEISSSHDCEYEDASLLGYNAV